jgi:hypothetical protein
MAAGAGDDAPCRLGAGGLRRLARRIGPGHERGVGEQRHRHGLHPNGVVLEDVAHENRTDDDHDHHDDVVAHPAVRSASHGRCPEAADRR